MIIDTKEFLELGLERLKLENLVFKEIFNWVKMSKKGSNPYPPSRSLLPSVRVFPPAPPYKQYNPKNRCPCCGKILRVPHGR